MSLSVSHFLEDLYDEHVEEAAFLYDFVRTAVKEADFQWIEAREFEDRREAHIDALVIGELAALARCRELADDGAGELYVYASTILRQSRIHEFAERMMALSLCRSDSLEALTSAIAEQSDATQLNDLSSGDLDSFCSVTLSAISNAMDRRGISTTTPDEADEWLGDQSDAEGHAALMTSAGPAYVHSLLASATSGCSVDVIRALAISGLPEVVRHLVVALDSDLAESAAAALFCITGAALMESVFEEEIIEEDELFDDERTAYRAGNKPKRVDGSAFGEERSRISIDPERWKQWLVNNKAQFVAGRRYRFGEAITPDCLVRVLRREDSQHWIRVHTVQELRCRYGVTAPFHVSLPVRLQLPCLLAMRTSVAALDQTVPGKWYLGGRIMQVGE